MFGRGLNWDRLDVERLIHKLILEGYLREEMIASKSDIMNAYIRIGPKAESLFNGLSKVKIIKKYTRYSFKVVCLLIVVTNIEFKDKFNYS